MSRVYAQQAREQGFRLAGSGCFNVAGDIARQGLAETDCDGKHSGHDVGYNYEQLRDQHLDGWNVDRVLLRGASTSGASVLPDPDFAADMCRAFNDWTLDK